MYTSIQEFQYVKYLETIAKLAEEKKPISKPKIIKVDKDKLPSN